MLIASVNLPVSQQLERGLVGKDLEVRRFGKNAGVPMLTTLTDETGVGVDRLLDALGAYERSKQACIVIDAGTAVTVDFVDGEGTFHGGAIAPGLRMMLRAMHQQTAALPAIDIKPELVPLVTEHGSIETLGEKATPPFGTHTEHAMTIGVVSAVRGLVHLLIDRYAEYYGGYPRVVATGGDAALLFENDPLVEAIVPDLTLIGMLAAVERLEQIGEASAEEDHGTDH